MAILSVGGYDGTAITEPQFGAAISDWSFEYGVIGAGDWKVTAHPSTPGAVNVAAGMGWGHGVKDISDSIVTVTQGSLPSSGTRWDTVVMHRDWQPPGGDSQFRILTGTSAKQLAIRDVNPGVEDDQPIALVQWTAGQTQPTEIVDLRVWAANGGMVAKDDLVLTYLAQLGSAVTVGGSRWQRVVGVNDTDVWARDVPPVIDIGQPAGFTPIFKGFEVAVQLDAYLVGQITFPTAFPAALRTATLERTNNTAGQTYFNVLTGPGQSDRTRLRFVAGGTVSAGQLIYVYVQAWGY